MMFLHILVLAGKRIVVVWIKNSHLKEICI